MKRLLICLGALAVLLGGSTYYHYFDEVHYEEYHTGKYDTAGQP